MRSIIKYFLLILLIVTAFFIGKELQPIIIQNSSNSESMVRFLNSKYFPILLSLVILYLIYDLLLEINFSYGRFGNIFKALVIISINVLSVFILIINEESHMIYAGEYTHGLPMVVCLPLIFLFRDLSKYEISKLNIALTFVFSILLYTLYAYLYDGFDYIVLFYFLGMAFASIVVFYIYMLGKTIMFGKKLIKSSKDILSK
ncbi:hypothetical protein ACKA01_08505 [Helcococcus kunzii]|uniref:hypothetical protein n=1 Tax=Helcococcus kunzii TaxID=40091 RepID=UPI0038AC692A